VVAIFFPVATPSVPTRSWVDYTDIDGLLLGSCGKPACNQLYEFLKRILDVIGASLLLVALSPLLLLTAALIRLDSPGPALFRQKRVGQFGKLFSIYKFRSMRVEAPVYAYSPRDSRDSRITRTGRLLRRTSLDELPQLINVLKGDMSLVGPRPEMPFIVQSYTERHRHRLAVKPGITGLWQISADRASLIHENIQYDLYYIQNRSLFMDIAILLHTAVFAMRGI
jgi:lipopolysaccharide/colanic/teichoic acid biosynthesis glycosyltransferase